MACVRKKCLQKAEWVPILVLQGPGGSVELEHQPTKLCHRHMMTATPGTVMSDKEFHHFSEHFAEVGLDHSKTQMKFKRISTGLVV